jgi:hypothetical protein
VNHHSFMSTSNSTDNAPPKATIAEPLLVPPPIEIITIPSATLIPEEKISNLPLDSAPDKEFLFVDLIKRSTVKPAEVVQVLPETTLLAPPNKTKSLVYPVKKIPVVKIPILPPPAFYPLFPWPVKPMAAPPPPPHDRAYNSIQFPADFDDDFANTLAAICKVTVNTRRYLYATGIHSMAAMVEFFPTHEDTAKFIDGVTKKEGKELKLPLYRDPNYRNQEVILRFPMVQQVRLKALRLYAVSHAYCGIPYNLPALDEATILRFGLFVTTIYSGKTTKDMPETGIPVLPALGNAADNYSVWNDKMKDFLSNYRSCYTGAPLNYLIRDDEMGKVAPPAAYETLDQFLIESMSFNPAINPAFIEENKLLAAVLGRSIGTSNPYATDILQLLGKGHGRAAWMKLKVRVNGTAKALFARVQTLELKLKAVYDGSMKGFQAIQNHNSAFVKTVQDLANAGSVIDMDRQIRDYLTTLQDPILLSVKDSIRADGGALTLEEVQQKFVDIIEGRKADAMSQATKHRAVKAAVVKHPKKDNRKKAQGAAGNTRKKWEGKKRKASQVNERLSEEEISLLKVSNPDDWFLTTKSIPPEVFKTMSQKDKKLMRKFRETENRAVKAVRTAEMTHATGVTVPDRNATGGAQMGPIVILTADQAFPIIQMLNQSTLSNQPVLTMPTVQFGRAPHQLKDVAHQDE